MIYSIIKYIGYFCLLLAVLLASSVITSTIFTALFSSEEATSAEPETPQAVKQIEQAYQEALQRAQKGGITVRIKIPDNEAVVSSTADGTCFTSSGFHTDCHGSRTASIVTLALEDKECSVMANAKGVMSSHCE